MLALNTDDEILSAQRLALRARALVAALDVTRGQIDAAQKAAWRDELARTFADLQRLQLGSDNSYYCRAKFRCLGGLRANEASSLLRTQDAAVALEAVSRLIHESRTPAL